MQFMYQFLCDRQGTYELSPQLQVLQTLDEKTLAGSCVKNFNKVIWTSASAKDIEKIEIECGTTSYLGRGERLRRDPILGQWTNIP